jgi:hypothetical protein
LAIIVIALVCSFISQVSYKYEPKAYQRLYFTILDTSGLDTGGCLVARDKKIFGYKFPYFYPETAGPI